MGVLLVGGAESLLLPPRHLLAQLEVAGGDHAADQRGEAQRYAGLCQHPVFDLDRVAQPGPSNIEHPRRRMHRVSSL